MDDITITLGDKFLNSILEVFQKLYSKSVKYQISQINDLISKIL